MVAIRVSLVLSLSQPNLPDYSTPSELSTPLPKNSSSSLGCCRDLVMEEGVL